MTTWLQMVFIKFTLLLTKINLNPCDESWKTLIDDCFTEAELTLGLFIGVCWPVNMSWGRCVFLNKTKMISLSMAA